MAKKNYSALVQLLKTRGFIDLVPVTREGRDYFLADYGPLGTLLRQNVLRQWWELMVVQQSNVFPIEHPALQASLAVEPDRSAQQKVDTNWRENLQQDCVSKYLQVLKLTNGRIPISIVSVGPCLSWRGVEKGEPEEKVLLFGSSNLTRVLLQNYVPPTGTSAVFDYWLQLRLSWWKKFSRHPANFSVTSGNSGSKISSEANSSVQSTLSSSGSKSNSQSHSNMCITYDFPWGPETIEEVRNLGDERLASLQEGGDQSYKVYSSSSAFTGWISGGKPWLIDVSCGSNALVCVINQPEGKTVGGKNCLPHCIECSSSIEAAMAAWLIDSFHERRPLSSGKKQERLKAGMVLQLHPQIAPYQVAIVISSSTTSSSLDSSSSPIELRQVCDQLHKDFRRAGVSLLNTSEHGSTLEAHLKRNDQLGIPYSVIVTDVSLTDGVVSTRKRDTGIQTACHISSVVEDLRRSLRAQLEEHG